MKKIKRNQLIIILKTCMRGSVWIYGGVRLRFMLFLIFDLCYGNFIYGYMVLYSRC